MSIQHQILINSLSPPLPQDVVVKLISEYVSLKKQFYLGHFKPSELDAGRFSECVLRIVEYEDQCAYTPIGSSLQTDKIINRAKSNTQLSDSVRFFIPQLIRVLLDVRNRRDVAHVANEVSPNISDSQLLCQCADWVLIELVRNYCATSIDEARKIVQSINDVKIPVVAEVDGFVRVQDTDLSTLDKTLVILYHKHPIKVSSSDLLRWTEYKNSSRYRKEVLGNLHRKAFIHYMNESCSLLPKGERYVEQNIDLEYHFL